ncbi:MAG: hypothetical protein ACNS61_15700, partial [Candidatus Wenzhouxiangella sp. M2_3B_020]
SIYEDPPAVVGTVEDALRNTLVSTLDPSGMPEAEADQILGDGPRCAFYRSPEDHPVLWASEESGTAAMKLNGVLVPLEAAGEAGDAVRFTASGATMTVEPLDEDADWRSDAELVFALERGLSVGYRGFWTCDT